MCGIVGIHDSRPDAPRPLARMIELITHRGPDEEGACNLGPVSLGVRRLKIIDLVTGRQPMTSEDGRVVAVYNGEIYNFRALRDELVRAGHVFRTKTDTEVLVHGYEQWGEGLIGRLNGMFGFAIWDGERLLLARDRMGEKPLYYAFENGMLVFASEIKAILPAFESAPDVDEEFWVYDTPVEGRTLFRGIRELLPGRRLIYDGKDLSVEPYWDIPASPPSEAPVERLAEELRELLIDAVNIRLMSDVPLGMFLSGGIDSAAIACIARPGTVYTCHFPLGAKFDELPFARLVAERIGARHTIVTPTVNDFKKRLPRVIWHVDQPIATASTISEFMLAERASADGIKVILGGQGADEIFGGYVRYLFMTGGDAPGAPELANYRSLAAYFEKGAGLPDDAARYHRLVRRAAPADDTPYENRLRRFFSRHDALIDKIGHADARLSLPSLLTMNDRACAAFGLENRCPFLDHRVVEFAFRLPPAAKIDGLRTKSVLRLALRGIVPDEILDRRDKMGLVVPFHQWLNGPLNAWAADLEASLARRIPLPDNNTGRGEFDRSRYTRVCLELWFRQFFPDYVRA
ncbi:asparagine synthase (glutamine-hydrolyzing) [bacterium]|nr:asparagine synthase (glutamine-hydrolyzing) [bacterium]